MSGKLVLLTGKMGSGKSAVSHRLVNTYDFINIKLASPLKDMLRAIGLTEDHIEGHLKNEPCELLNGKTPRYAMQTLGTEWGRNLIGNDLWLNLALKKILMFKDAGRNVVVDDLRFVNELHYLRVNVGYLKSYRIIRPGLDSSTHISEQEIGLLTVDHVVFNDGTLEQLNSKVDQIVRTL